MGALEGTGTKLDNGVNIPKDKLFIDSLPVTASAAELNALDGITSTVTELNNLRSAVTTASTTANIANYKRVSFGSTAAVQTFTLDAPTLGATVDIICTGVVSSTQSHIVWSGTTPTFDGTNRRANFTAANQVLRLLGSSTTRWNYDGSSTSITFST